MKTRKDAAYLEWRNPGVKWRTMLVGKPGDKIRGFWATNIRLFEDLRSHTVYGAPNTDSRWSVFGEVISGTIDMATGIVNIKDHGWANHGTNDWSMAHSDSFLKPLRPSWWAAAQRRRLRASPTGTQGR